MKFEKCGICKEYHWTNKQCLPEWRIFHEDHLGDDYKLVRAGNPEDAAIAYARLYNASSDYCLMNEEIEILVEENGKKVGFIIGAEPDVHYTAIRK